jgi:hypothetical protein
VDSEADHVYASILQAAEVDSNVIGFILCGSRGKGFETENSDYDFVIVTTDDAHETWTARMSPAPSGIDVVVHTMQSFSEHAAWNGPYRGYRYDFAHLCAQIDRTGGQIQRLIDEKAKVPEAEVDKFIRLSLDHYINQAYRSIKCLRDGNEVGHRLEAANSIQPLLNALFALHQRRLRPYYKYLRWELTRFPLEHLPWPADKFLEMLLSILMTGSCEAQQTIFRWLDTYARTQGYAEVFEAWGTDLWIADYVLPITGGTGL